MSEKESKVPVQGSERKPAPGARVVGDVPAAEQIEVTIVVRRKAGAALPDATAQGAQLPGERPRVSREEFASQYGADPADIKAVADFAKAEGFTILEEQQAARTIRIRGSAAQVQQTFQVDLKRYDSDLGHYRGRVGDVHVPPSIAPLVEGIFGLDNRRQASPRVVAPDVEDLAVRLSLPMISNTPDRIARLYDFPPSFDGQAECVGLLEFGGGFLDSDLAKLAQQIGIQPPQVVAVSAGANNDPGPDPDSDGEVALDIQVVAAAAPGARIAVYFAPFTEQGWVNAIRTAVHDARNKPSVLSISWGFAEGQDIWTPQALKSVNDALQEAAILGVTVCVASGDDGAADDISDGKVHADFPATSPFALGCGGSSIGVTQDRITDEVVWNHGPRARKNGGASGGGISEVFPLPPWQSSAAVPVSVGSQKPGRGVPDVSAVADGRTGYTIVLRGQVLPNFGGTSAAAPLVAALIARCNQAMGTPVGYLNPLLYTRFAALGVTRDITSGSNDTTGSLGGYSARTGWDACTGWGSFVGTSLLHGLQGKPVTHAELVGTRLARSPRALSPEERRTILDTVDRALRLLERVLSRSVSE